MPVDWNLEDPLEKAVYPRLNAVDAPELSAVHFVKTDDLKHTFCKRMGHLSLCGLNFFICLFLYTGCAELCEELPKRWNEMPRRSLWTSHKGILA